MCLHLRVRVQFNIYIVKICSGLNRVREKMGSGINIFFGQSTFGMNCFAVNSVFYDVNGKVSLKELRFTAKNMRFA